MGMDSHLFCWEKFLDAVTSLGLTNPHLILSHFASFIFSNACSVVSNYLSNGDRFLAFILETLLSALESSVVLRKYSELMTP